MPDGMDGGGTNRGGTDAGGINADEANAKASRKWSDLFARRAAPGREGWFFAIDNPRLRRRIEDAHMDGLDPFSWLRAQLGWGPPDQAGPLPRALEIGCGAGDLAIGLMQAGWFTQLDAFDVAEGAIASAQARAMAAGLDGLRFFVADGNTLALPPDSYDLIYASHALHHITDLEHLFAGCAAALRPGGVLFATDYVGPSRMQYSDAHLLLMNDMLARLPPEKRIDSLNGFGEKLLIGRTPLEAFEKHDPSEAPRSAEIIPALGQAFDVQVRHYGMELTYEVLLGIVHTFDPQDPADNALIDRLFEMDAAAARGGQAAPMFANLVARPHGRPQERNQERPQERPTPAVVQAAAARPAAQPAPAMPMREPDPGPSGGHDFAALLAALPGPDVPPGIADALDGWLWPEAADLTVRLCRLQAALGMRSGVLELGVYRGKYLALLATLHEGLPLVGVDIFTQRIGESIEAQHIPYVVALVVDGIRGAVPGAVPLILPARTRDLDAPALLAHCPAGYSFVSVDAGHEADDVAHDLGLAASVLAPGGIVALDDAFRAALPGVAEGLFRWLATPAGTGLAAFAHGGNKLFLCRPDRHGTWLGYARWLTTQNGAGYLAASAEQDWANGALRFVPRVAGREVAVFDTGILRG